MEETICMISFSRCSTITELSATKVCSCEDVKSYKNNEHTRVQMSMTYQFATGKRPEFGQNFSIKKSQQGSEVSLQVAASPFVCRVWLQAISAQYTDV